MKLGNLALGLPISGRLAKGFESLYAVPGRCPTQTASTSADPSDSEYCLTQEYRYISKIRRQAAQYVRCCLSFDTKVGINK